MLIERRFTIYASLHADIESGYVWLAGLDLKSARSVFKVKNTVNGKYIYVEALSIEENFKRHYAQGRTLKTIQWDQAAILNSWYRSKLGIEKTNTDVILNIKKIKPWNRVCACLDHPSLPIRIATWLGIIGLWLGWLSLMLTLK